MQIINYQYMWTIYKFGGAMFAVINNWQLKPSYSFPNCPYLSWIRWCHQTLLSSCLVVATYFLENV